MENHPINRADITVVPYFNTNEDLAQAICDKLNSYLERTSIIEHQPLTAHGPKFLVYRPSGRAGDEFKEHVSRHLMNQTGVKTYLIIASSTKPADQFSISKDDQDKLQDEQTKLVIDEGRLVDKNESYYDSNRTELWKLAEDICRKYKNIQMRPISRILSVGAVLLACWDLVALFLFPLLVFYVSLAFTFVKMILSTLKKCLENACMSLVHFIRNTWFACGFSDDYINV